MAALAPPQEENPSLAVELVEHALAFREKAAEVLDRPTDGVAVIPADVAVVNDAALDLVQAIARKQQIAHSPSLLTLSPKVHTNTLGSDSASKGRYLAAVTAWGAAA